MPPEHLPARGPRRAGSLAGRSRTITAALALCCAAATGCLWGYDTFPREPGRDAGRSPATAGGDPPPPLGPDAVGDDGPVEAPLLPPSATARDDTDGDGWSDADEVTCGSAPALAASTPADLNGDGTADCLEGPLGEYTVFLPFNGSPDDAGRGRLRMSESAPAPSPVPDRHGAPDAAYGFSGESCQHFANDAQSTPAAGGDELSVSVWILANDTAPIQKIVGHAHRTDGSDFRGWVVGIGNGKLNPEVWDEAGDRVIFSAGEVPAGQWVHLAVTWRSGGTLRGYVDGALVAEVPASARPIGDAPDASLKVGVRPWATPDWCFDGAIDEVKIYDRELTAGQVAVLAR